MSSTLTHVVQLEWTDNDGIVTVTPQDKSRFNIKLNKAVEVLQLADKVDQFQQQFNLLLQELAAWLKGKSSPGIAKAFVTLRDGGLAFVVVRESSEYDEQFEDALSDLDFKIANDVDLDLIKLDTIALPCVSDEAMGSFLDPGFTLSYIRNYGESGKPPRSSE